MTSFRSVMNIDHLKRRDCFKTPKASVVMTANLTTSHINFE